MLVSGEQPENITERFFIFSVLFRINTILSKNFCQMKFLFAFIFIFTGIHAIAQTDTKMNSFISSLMSKMTIDEKIGQLNLVTPGGAVTGSVVSSDVDNKIRNGQVGGLFGINGPDQIRKAQGIAVNSSRLKIPLMFGLDVIHGHRTI